MGPFSPSSSRFPMAAAGVVLSLLLAHSCLSAQPGASVQVLAPNAAMNIRGGACVWQTYTVCWDPLGTCEANGFCNINGQCTSPSGGYDDVAQWSKCATSTSGLTDCSLPTDGACYVSFSCLAKCEIAGGC